MSPWYSQVKQSWEGPLVRLSEAQQEIERLTQQNASLKKELRTAGRLSAVDARHHEYTERSTDRP